MSIPRALTTGADATAADTPQTPRPEERTPVSDRAAPMIVPIQRTRRTVPITKKAIMTRLIFPMYFSSVREYIAPRVMTPIFRTRRAVFTPGRIQPAMPIVFTQRIPRMIPRKM
jgi:hypothetical protein